MLFTEVDRALNKGMTIEFDLAESGALVRQVRFIEAGGSGTIAEGCGVTIEAALTEACLNDTLRRLKRPMTVTALAGGMTSAESDLDQLVWRGFRLRVRRENKRMFACELRQYDCRVERFIEASSFLDALLKLGQAHFIVSFA